jgi:hypothetical protein
MKMVLTLALGLAMAMPAAAQPFGGQRYDDRRGAHHDGRGPEGRDRRGARPAPDRRVPPRGEYRAPPGGDYRGPPPRDWRRSDQQEAFDARRAGRILPLPEIEKRIVPGEAKRGGRYIGFDFESPSGVYTLKFLRDGTVIWIEVDGRTGQVLGRTDQ